MLCPNGCKRKCGARVSMACQSRRAALTGVSLGRLRWVSQPPTSSRTFKASLRAQQVRDYRTGRLLDFPTWQFSLEARCAVMGGTDCPDAIVNDPSYPF